jgi:hypothetical protein
MRFLALFLTSAFCSCLAVAPLNCSLMDHSQARAGLRSDNEPSAPRLAPFPLQLEMRVPFDPTALAFRLSNQNDELCGHPLNLYKDEAGEKRIGPGDFLRVPGGHKHWSGGDKKEGALFYEESSGKFDFIPVK